jgi:protein FrlC
MGKLDLNKLCATNFTYYRYSFDYYLNDVQKLGLNAIEIWAVEPHLNIDEVKSADLQALKQNLRRRDIKVQCVTPEQIAYPLNIAAKDEGLRQRSLKHFFRTIEICAELEAPFVLLASGSGFEDEPREEAWKRSADSIAQIATAAEKAGITLTMEGLQPCESNVICTIEEIGRMRKEINSPALKVAIDSVAMAVNNETIADFMNAFGDEVLHSHFIDGEPAGHMAWGDGKLPLDKYIAELAAGNYQGYLSFEAMGPRYWLDPLKPMAQCVDAVRESIIRQGLAA